MKKIILIASALFLLAQAPVFAQLSLFSTAKANRADRKEAPTVINADAMDIDIANNKATFMGNVLVDDPEMTITCRKMTIFLEDEKKEDKKPEAKAEDKTAKADSAKKKNAEKPDLKKPAAGSNTEAKTESEDPVAGKKLSRIECVDDVVITRKNLLSNGEEQKALAGKAVYNFGEGTIELSDKPVVIKGKSRIQGEKITLFTESERITIVNATATTTDFDSNSLKK